MTLEQLKTLVTKQQYLQGLGYFKTAQDDYNDGRFAATVVKLSTAEAGYAASYEVRNAKGTKLGATINIPKDFLVKSATLETVATDDTPYTGAVVGDTYIDFVINTKADGDGSTETDTHIYLPVNDLIDIYTAGNGIEVSNEGVIAVKIDSTNANGLATTVDGLKLNLATADSVSYVAATGTFVTGTTYYADSAGAATVDTTSFEDGVTDVSSYYVAQTTSGTAGAMSAADKNKLDALDGAVITQSDILALFS